MVTLTSGDLDDLVNNVAFEIEFCTGISTKLLDLQELDRMLRSFLDGYGVQYDEDVLNENEEE